MPSPCPAAGDPGHSADCVICEVGYGPAHWCVTEMWVAGSDQDCPDCAADRSA